MKLVIQYDKCSDTTNKRQSQDSEETTSGWGAIKEGSLEDMACIYANS